MTEQLLSYVLLASCLFIQPFHSAAQRSAHLFPIEIERKIGYINQDGKVVVAPQYLNGSEFSEGLALVRKGGYYGYIDSKGDFVIPARFDYALPFQEGIAIVYKNGEPFYIDKSGMQLFSNPYQHLSPFENGIAKVKSLTGKEGCVDRTGRLVIDTAFSNIYRFYEGVAIVEGINYRKNNMRGKYISEVGLIDRSGKFIVPYSVYDEIKDFDKGLALVKVVKRNDDNTERLSLSGFMDAKGNVILLREDKNNSRIDGPLSNNRAKAQLYKYWIPDPKGVLWTSEKRYVGYVNRKGDVVLNDTLLDEVTDFAEGRAFVKQRFGEFFLIDTNGNKVTSQGFSKVLHERFIDGKAFVYANGKWGLIDRSGNYLSTPKYYEIDERGLIGDAFFYGAPNPNGDSDVETLYGIAKADGREVTPPLFEWCDGKGFVNGLLRVRLNDALAYVDTTGKVVWQGRAEKDTLKDLNIDFMNRAYCYARSTIPAENYNGWGGSENGSVKLEDRDDNPGLYLFIDTTAKMVFQKEYNGYLLKVVNNTKDTFFFNAQDSRLYLTLQALDQKGEWRNIEYSPNSWCGNSYHTIALAPKNKWIFTIPKYEGGIATRFRAALRYIKPNQKKKGKANEEVYAYSNELLGSVNPGQFWRKPGYQSGGLMDPYNE